MSVSRAIVGVDRNEIVLAGKLHAIAGEIDHGDGVGAGRLRLLDEIAESSAQRVAVEVARADHVEARRLQRLRDQAAVVGGGRERRLGVGAVADHQRDALFLLLGKRWSERGEKARASAECRPQWWIEFCIAAHASPPHAGPSSAHGS